MVSLPEAATAAGTAAGVAGAAQADASAKTSAHEAITEKHFIVIAVSARRGGS
jgi:hypothetical protein